MAVPVQTPSKEYTANGITTAFPLEFDCDKAEYLIVTLDGNEAPVGSWSLLSNTVTFLTAPVNGAVVLLERNTPYQRTTNYQSYDNSFRPTPVNKDFDLIWWKLQELGYRDQVIWLALVKEISDRINGDENLQTQIDEIDTWLENLQENVDQNTADIEQLVNDLSKEIADRIKGDQILKDMFLSMIDEAINEGTINALAITHVDSLAALDAISNVWDGRTVYVKDLGNYRYDALTTSWVKAYQDAGNVIDGTELQKKINDKIIPKVASISELISIVPRVDGYVVDVISYHDGKNIGGDKFEWNASLSKTSHDGGYIIDPLIQLPLLSNFNTYYTPKNIGVGCWRRVPNESIIKAENYGLSTDSDAVWGCAAIQSALYKAASFSTPKNVTIGAGTFRTTNPIIISKIHSAQGTSGYYRVPKLIGSGRGTTEIIKTTNNSVGVGYLTSDVDAVIFCCPKIGDIYSMYDEISGISVQRFGTIFNVGYGFYLRASIYGERKNLRALGGGTGYFQTDCWMSQVNNILAENNTDLGIGITSGTSVTGRNLYVTSCAGVGIDLAALTYSDLSVHTDGGGHGSPDGNYAIKGSLTHGVRLLASTEDHRGTEYYFTNSKGVVITGRSYNSQKLSSSGIPKIRIDYESNVIFQGYDWEKVFNNRTQAEAQNYIFMANLGTPNCDFSGCTFNNYFKDYVYALASGKLNRGKSSSSYREDDRVIRSKIGFIGTTYIKCAFIHDCGRIFIEKAITTNPSFDRYFDFSATGIAKSAISTNSATPTKLSASYYDAGVSGPMAIWGYVDLDGWLWVRLDVTSGNNLEYQFILRK
ncbi:hypothetical protein [Acinetobacter gyllenbergii]|uniref:hypothetical protein n=1 Tax=Acinetobacter gyllenbergii TaxID=134534 RepID=UPI0003BE5773|nr:hypothetical protein [Acinetobacter gyllenbergii]ESK50178.1 hypothetical protein F987_01614 [Acinetobacter gyllenbergii NIPH 230]